MLYVIFKFNFFYSTIGKMCNFNLFIFNKRGIRDKEKRSIYFLCVYVFVKCGATF